MSHPRRAGQTSASSWTCLSVCLPVLIHLQNIDIGFKAQSLPLHIHCNSAQWRRRFDSMIYLSPNPCHQSPRPATKITSWCLFASQLFFHFFTNITQLRPVHDGIDAIIPGLQTQAGFLQAALKSPSTCFWTGHIHIHTPLTVLFRHKIGPVISHSFAQSSV